MKNSCIKDLVICFLAGLFTLSLGIEDANGDDRFWIGGNGDWVDGVGVGFWTPGNDEPDPDDVAIFNTNNNVDLGSNNEVEGLTLSNSIDLSTSTFFLDVNGPTSLTGVGTRLTAGGNNLVGVPANGLDVQDVTIGSGSTFSIGGTTVDIAEPGSAAEGLLAINSGGTLFGNGRLDSDDLATSTFNILSNNGTISVGDVGGAIFVGTTPPARTLTFSASDDVNARVDLDGFLFSPFPTVVENGIVNVGRNQTLDVDVQLSDTFNGTLNLNQESQLDIENGWALGAGGLINVDNGSSPGIFPLPNIPAGNATIAGGTLTQTGGTIDVVDDDGTLTFEADFVGNGGTLDNSESGTVVFQGTTTINDGHTYLQGIGAVAIVDGGTTTINDANFDLDGAGTAQWEVTNGGRLNVRSDMLDTSNNSFGGTLGFDGGVIDIDVDGSSYENTGTIRSDSGGTLIGDRVIVGDDGGSPNEQIDVNGGALVIEAPVTLLSDSNINVAAGSTLILNSPDTIVAPVNGANNGVFTGSGNLFIRGAQFDEATTLDFSGGTVGLDGLVGNNSTLFELGLPAADTDINANLTINAATFDDYGTTVFPNFSNPFSQSELNISNTGRLAVNLDDPTDSWTVLSNGIINYSGDASAGNFLAGSDINLDGTLNVTGDGRSTARLDIGGTININTAGEFLRLNAGGSTHTLAGGTINGPGSLFTETNDDLTGNGTINANIDFNGTSDLAANGGLLDVNGAITDVHTIRSQGAGTTLDLAQALNTNVTGNGISVEGGTIQGNTITLSTRNLRGQGTVSNRLVNDNVVRALGGQLTLNNALSDYDGAGNSGELQAQTGDLRIVDNASFGFNGTVVAESGRLVLADGFELQLNAASTLDLNGGSFQSTVSTDFLGSIDTAAGQTSTISTPGSHFNSSATLQLDGDLEVIDDSLFTSGVTASGGGRLIAADFGRLTLGANVDLDVFVENQSEVSIAGAATGRADVGDYLQDDSGSILFGLETTTLGDFDRLIVSGNAELAGEIELANVGAGTFDAYDTISILSATSGVIDTFDTVAGITDGLPLGQGFAVTYDPTSVFVTRALLGDANLDGNVDVLTDVFALVGNLGTTSGATFVDGDFTGDGAVDVLGDVFALVGNLGTTFGASSSLALSASAVPEPGSATLIILAGITAIAQRRRQA